MPKIPSELSIAQLAELRWQCSYQHCGAIHHYLPADKRGCRRCGSPLIVYQQYRSKQNEEVKAKRAK